MSREDVDGDGDLTLKSPTLPAGSPRFPAMSSSNDAENVPERSSSPALKRSASELDEQRPEPDVGTEVGSPLRMVSVPATTPMDGVFDGSRGSEREDDAASPQPNGRSPPGRLMTVRPLSRLEADEEAMVGTATSGLAVNDGPVHAPNGAAAAPSPADENPGEVAPGTADASDIPSIDEQIAQVTALTLKPLGEGDRGHVVPCKWLARVMARGSDKPAGRSYGKDAAEGEIGAVDNSDLVPESERARSPHHHIDLHEDETDVTCYRQIWTNGRTSRMRLASPLYRSSLDWSWASTLTCSRRRRGT